jgi:hypothetical protein
MGRWVELTLPHANGAKVAVNLETITAIQNNGNSTIIHTGGQPVVVAESYATVLKMAQGQR